MKWEYITLRCSDPVVEPQCVLRDKLGREGWDLFSVVFAGGIFYHYFKRQLK